VEKSTQLLDSVSNYIQQVKMHNVELFFNDGEMGLSGARNKGIENATGEILGFVDDDVVLFPNWAEATVETFSNDSTVIAITGPAFPLWEDDSMKWLPQELQWIVGATSFWSSNKITEVRNVWGMNMSFRREAFEKYGGFLKRMSDFTEKGVAKHMLSNCYDNVVPHEDVELSLRITQKNGKRIVYNPDVKVLHRATKSRLRLSFIMKEALHQGCAKRMINRLNTTKDLHLLKRENDVLIKILKNLLPSTIIRFPKEPYNSWRKFSITMFTLFFLCLGYASPIFFEYLAKPHRNH
jgi:glucosyl-dolichyl phosphate glucuronosyltransferase